MKLPGSPMNYADRYTANFQKESRFHLIKIYKTIKNVGKP